jgi:hypothetical protein
MRYFTCSLRLQQEICVCNSKRDILKAALQSMSVYVIPYDKFNNTKEYLN